LVATGRIRWWQRRFEYGDKVTGDEGDEAERLNSTKVKVGLNGRKDADTRGVNSAKRTQVTKTNEENNV
jgi:hypothetical protein